MNQRICAITFGESNALLVSYNFTAEEMEENGIRIGDLFNVKDIVRKEGCELIILKTETGHDVTPDHRDMIPHDNWGNRGSPFLSVGEDGTTVPPIADI